MHQGCQRLQLAAAEPGCARVGPRTCLCSTEADKCLGPVKPHHHRLQMAAAEPGCARVGPRTCIRDASTTTASNWLQQNHDGHVLVPEHASGMPTPPPPPHQGGRDFPVLATKSTPKLIHSRRIAHPQGTSNLLRSQRRH